MKELCFKYGIVVCPKSEPTRQMVLGTDNQETYFPWLLSCMVLRSLYPNMPPYPGAPPLQKPTQVYALVETGGEFGSTQVHKPFSLLELRQIKQDLGSYTDEPGKYMDTFQHIILVFDLIWKDIKVIFSETLSDHEYARVLREAQRYTMGLHMSPSHVTFIGDKYAVGKTAVPS